MRLFLALSVFSLSCLRAGQQEDTAAPKTELVKSEPAFSDTFSGPIVELFYIGESTKRAHPSDQVTKITVSRSVLGKPAEKRTFWIKTDTRIEGNLRMKAKVTVGYIEGDDGNVARLIVVRTAQQNKQEKK